MALEPMWKIHDQETLKIIIEFVKAGILKKREAKDLIFEEKRQ